jgi:hypothetical protein
MNARLGQRSGGRIAHAACHTHARRELVAAEKNHPREAAKALAFYKRLDAVEAPCKLLPAPERLPFRRRESLPIWDRFREWINSDAMRGILPKSRLGKTLTYINNHWEALRRYLDDGRLPIDNNQSKQTIRLFVLEGGTGPFWDIRKRQPDARICLALSAVLIDIIGSSKTT